MKIYYARTFVLGHYLFQETNTFPRAQLNENCELRGTDNVQGKISLHVFSPNRGYCFYYQIFFAVLKIGEYSRTFPSFSYSVQGFH